MWSYFFYIARFQEDNPCGNYLLVCCGLGDRPISNDGQNTGGISTGNIIEKPVAPPTKVKPDQCGHRNVNGIGFKISGNIDNEAEYGEVLKTCKKKLFHFKPFLYFPVSMDGGSSKRYTLNETTYIYYYTLSKIC